MFTYVRHPSLLAIPVLLLISVLPQAAAGVTLESAYVGASSYAGYDKYVVLTAGVTYTGGLTIPAGDTACIKGNGALIDLQSGTIHVGGAYLDIDHCVILNGGDPAYGPSKAALNFVAAHGNVINNTIYGSTVGIRVYQTSAGAVTVENSILAKNTYAGVVCELGCEANITYNDGWSNTGYGNYAIDYYCVNGGIQPWTPSPGTGNISANPLFVDAAALDFHLAAGSPCLGAGDPAGTDMGALGNSGGGGGGDQFFFKTYYPTAATMLIGTVGAGSYLSLGADDDAYLRVNAAKSGKKFYTDWYCTTIIDQTPVELTITYNGRYSTNRSQALYLYNFVTHAWSLINMSTVGTTDVTKTYTTSSPGGFVSATGEIRVRLAGSANSKAYSCYADYVAITIKYTLSPVLAFEPGKEGETFNQDFGGATEPASTPPAVATGLEAWPNPFNPTVRIAFELERPTTGLLSVYDVSGHKLVELARGTLDAGRHVVVWDGKDSDGRALSSGTYIAKLDGDGVSESLKLVMLK